MTPPAASSSPLARKLGIPSGTSVLLLGDPMAFDRSALGATVTVESAGHGGVGAERFPVVLLFCPDLAELSQRFPAAAASHTLTGSLWVCWAKKASRLPTDLTDEVVRTFGLAHGRVDVKVAAIDDVWSGLKFVIRLKDRQVRPAIPARPPWPGHRT